MTSDNYPNVQQPNGGGTLTADGTSTITERWNAPALPPMPQEGMTSGASDQRADFLDALRRSSTAEDTQSTSITDLLLTDDGDQRMIGSNTSNTMPPRSTPLIEQIEKSQVAAGKQRNLNSLVIPAAITIRGDILGADDIVVLGTVTGEINLPRGAVAVGRTGKVDGNISAGRLAVQGVVNGDLKADEVEVLQGGAVRGNICAPTVILERGSQVEGFVRMDMSQAPASSPSDALAEFN